MGLLRLNRKRKFVVAFLVAMSVCNLFLIVSLIPSLRRGYQDFTIFYSAGCLLRRGQAANLYSLSEQYRVQREFAPDVPIRQAALPYNHPPFEALLFVPFTFLKYLPAYALWSALNLIMLASSLVLLRKEFADLRAFPLAFLGLAATGFLPVVLGILQGQDDVLLLLMITVGLILLQREEDASAGGVLALGLFKPQLVMPLVLLLAIRRPRVLVGFVPVGIVLALISVAIVGLGGAINYVRFVFYLEKSGAGGAVGSDYMPNFHGLIACLLDAGRTRLLAAVLTLTCSVALILIASWKIRKVPDSICYAFGLATVTAILVSYHALAYDLSLLLPVVLLLFSRQDPMQATRTRVETTLLLLLLFLTPLYVLLLLWLPVHVFCWFSLVLLWLFWRLGQDQPELGRQS